MFAGSCKWGTTGKYQNQISISNIKIKYQNRCRWWKTVNKQFACWYSLFCDVCQSRRACFLFLFSSCSLYRESNKFICAFEICNFWRLRDKLVRDCSSESMMERLAGCPWMFNGFFFVFCFLFFVFLPFGGKFTSFLIGQSACLSKILLSFVLTASCKML